MNLLTRSDFDGLACATILKSIGIIDTWKFVHPKDLQDGSVEVTENDVLANVPYVKGCGMWFDHHISEEIRNGKLEFKGSFEALDSAAHVIYNYYKKSYDLKRFDEMLKAVDKVDAAHLSKEEILNPTGWVLLGFIMDPRTGLGRFRDFTIPNYRLMEELIDMCANHPIDVILKNPNVIERTELYMEHSIKFKHMLLKYSKAIGNVVVTDLRDVETIFAGNRFTIYAMFPEQNVSIWVVDGKQKQNVSIAVGYSVLNRTATANIGEILLSFGGGGHHQVGTCQVVYGQCDETLKKLINLLK